MAAKIDTTRGLAKELTSNPEFLKEFKADPVGTVKKVQGDTPLSTDNWIYRIVVLALGTTVISIVIGVIALMNHSETPVKDENIPTILTALGSAAIGAIAGLLAPPPKAAPQE